MTDALFVRTLGRLVGTILRDDHGALSFTYDPTWLGAGGAFALAESLPLSTQTYRAEYFANLLPEARFRNAIAQAIGISADNDFEFLRRFGADCAGAVEIVAPPEVEQAFAVPLRVLTDDDAAWLTSTSGATQFYREEFGARLSLAGAQAKLLVVRTEKGLAIPLDGRPSTHLLKLPNESFRGIVENEALILSLAGALGLPSVAHEVVVIGGVPVLLVERYDRIPNTKGAIVRLHQQDLCQALGYPPGVKYEGEGGPTLKDVFELVRRVSAQPLNDVRHLLKWTAFNVLVHNGDAHAKNVSLLRAVSGTQRLAPFYDLICTGAYEQLSRTLANRIGGVERPGDILGKHWRAFAKEVGVAPRLVVELVDEMAAALPDAFHSKLATLHAALPRIPRRQQLERTVLRGAATVRKNLAG